MNKLLTIILVPISILIISFIVLVPICNQLDQNQLDNWKTRCRAAQGVVVEDYNGNLDCLHPKVKVIKS